MKSGAIQPKGAGGPSHHAGTHAPATVAAIAAPATAAAVPPAPAAKGEAQNEHNSENTENPEESFFFFMVTGLSQMKLKSRHFENYPISGNQKPLRAFSPTYGGISCSAITHFYA
jgi:hypothetical protein